MTILWKPSADQIRNANVTKLISYAETRFGVSFVDYHDFYRWSIEKPEEFWASVWDYCGIIVSKPYEVVLRDKNNMPGASWFPGSELNFAENLLRYRDSQSAIVFWGEDQVRDTITYAELFNQVAWVSAAMREMGVEVGDRVAGVMPNMPQAVVAMLATASIGGIWSSCSPDFGVEGIVDRFGQVQPKVLVTADGYFYNGKKFDSAEKIERVVAAIPSIRHTIVVPYVEKSARRLAAGRVHYFPDLIGKGTAPKLNFTQVPFDQPLYVMFSSGTTGPPKCIVHGVGGTLIEHLKELAIHTDLGRADRIFYFTTCGWMMWNWLISALATGATLLLYDGSPSLCGMQILFDFADEERISVFGTSASFISAIRKHGLQPAQTHRLRELRTILSTGSPLVPENYNYVYAHIKRDVQLSSISGGTDIIGCFALGIPVLPVRRGALQTRSLGYAVDVFDDAGHPLVDIKGELVCTAPFPSMPVSFWNDPDGSKYHDAYFARFENIWCHGDYVTLTKTGDMIFYGRSDSTLNPCGVRIGTAEIYRQLERIEAIESSVVVDQQWKEETRIVLFVKLKPGMQLNEGLSNEIRAAIRTQTTPRHVPKKIIQVIDIPITRSGKISELAVRNVIHGVEVKFKDALANAEALDYFKDLAELRTG